jgi:OmpA-OmpF porin, OOP family
MNGALILGMTLMSAGWGKALLPTTLQCLKPLTPRVERDLDAKGRVLLKDVRFLRGTDVIASDSLPILKDLARAMRRRPRWKFTIEGHTDARGTPDHGQELSERRAKRVKEWLVANGVKAESLSTVGFGATKPSTATDAQPGQPKNERIEVATEDLPPPDTKRRPCSAS